MTHHPEDAMTRERALDETYAKAWDAYMDAIVATDHKPPSSSGLRAALASAQQEPAPAADAEEASRIWFAGCVGFPTMQSREAFRAGWLAHEAAALRRYAGDSGVTARLDAVKAEIKEIQADLDEHPSVRAVGGYRERRLYHLLREQSNLEAAARAKSGEKGGANV